MLTDEQQRLIASIKGPRVTRLELTKIGPDGHGYVETLDGDDAALWQAYTQSTGVLAHAHGARAPFGSLNWQRRSTPPSVRAAAEGDEDRGKDDRYVAGWRDAIAAIKTYGIEKIEALESSSLRLTPIDYVAGFHFEE